ncbi:MAG TPA: AI-2E family transporter [Chthoniobacterales bacterium]|nr:AI-2E family transporter [Chthoniobacterales bacterium]
MNRTNISGTNFRTAFVLLLVLGVTLLFLAVTWPFLKPLLLGAMLAGLSRPLYYWITRRVGGRPSLGAALTLLLLFVLVVGPISAFVGVVVGQAVNVSTQAIPWLQQHFGAASTFNAHDWLVQRFPALGPYLPDQAKFVENLGAVAQQAGGVLVAGASRIGAGTATFLLNLFVMMYAMFFFLRDGRTILEKVFYYMPLDPDDEELVLQRFTSVTRATIKGTLVIGIIQGALAGIGFWVAGIDGAAFWGTIMVVLSIVPGIGAALIWVPAVIYLFLTGQALAGTLLGAWCAAVVGTVDNVLRPALVGKDAKMPDLLILVGTLGGLFLFGPIGFIVGPIVCGLFLTVWDIYGTTFRDVLPPVRDLHSGREKRPGITLGDNTPRS